MNEKKSNCAVCSVKVERTPEPPNFDIETKFCNKCLKILEDKNRKFFNKWRENNKNINKICANCSCEISKGNEMSLSRWPFCYSCGIRCFDYWDNNELKWVFVPKGKSPVYKNGKYIGVK